MKSFKTNTNGITRNVGIALCAVGLLILPGVAKAATVIVKNCDHQAPIVVSAIATDGWGGTKGERYYSPPIKLGESYSLDVPTITNGSIRVEASGFTQIGVKIAGGRNAYVYAVWNMGWTADTRPPDQHSWEYHPLVVTNRDHETPIVVSAYQVDGLGHRVDLGSYPDQVVYSPEIKKGESCTLQIPLKLNEGPEVRVEAREFNFITVDLRDTLHISAVASNFGWALVPGGNFRAHSTLEDGVKSQAISGENSALSEDAKAKLQQRQQVRQQAHDRSRA